jgi:hypothetical protein
MAEPKTIISCDKASEKECQKCRLAGICKIKPPEKTDGSRQRKGSPYEKA